MRALVTGGTGFVGSHLVDELLKNDYTVKVLVRPTSNLRYLKGKPVSLITGDLSDISSLIAACKGNDVIFHVAALPHEQRHLRSFYKVNTKGTKNLLEASTQTDVRHFVLMSTTSIYGFPPIPILKEEHATMPKTRYGRSKYLAEQLLWHYGKTHNMHVAAVRAPWITGPRNYKTPHFIRTIQQGHFFYVRTPQTTISIVDVRDVAACLRQAAEYSEVNSQAMNVKSFDCTVQAYIEAIAAKLSVPLPTRTLPLQTALIFATCAEAVWLPTGREPPITRHQVRTLATTRTFDISRALAIGYKPQHIMEKTVADTIDWAQKTTSPVT
jgi:nucleoside-diphosphate-sugar epimerase